MLIDKSIEKNISKMKKAIDDDIANRLNKEILPTGIIKETYNYANDKQEMHEMNVFLPNNKEDSLPTIIDIHGGAWLSGDKELNRNFCMHLAKYGYCTISMSYRLCATNHIEDEVKDIITCYSYIVKHHKKLHVDLDNIYLTGDSAGGMLALLTYATNNNDDLATGFKVEKAPIRIKAITVNHPVAYMHDIKLTKNKLLNKITLNILIKKIAGKKKSFSAKNFSFENYKDKVDFPPILIITSAGDEAFSPQSKKLFEDLKSKNSKVVLDFKEDKSLQHVFNVSYPDTKDGKETNKRIIDFFKQY